MRSSYSSIITVAAAALSMLSPARAAFVQHQHYYRLRNQGRTVVVLGQRLITNTNMAPVRQEERSFGVLKRTRMHVKTSGNDKNNMSLMNEEQSSNIGKNNQHLQMNVARENRIAQLEELAVRTDAQEAALQGLRQKSNSFEEQYDPSLFSDKHHAFKAAHNQAFCQLANYCCSSNEEDDDGALNALFYLDGPDGLTTKALLDFQSKDGTDNCFQAHQLYVANRHEASCVKLRRETPLPDANIVCESAATALQQYMYGDESGSPSFVAYYLDGCGGYEPQIMDMLTAALQSNRASDEQSIAIGFSLVGGNNRDVMNKEVAIAQHLVQLSKKRNSRMRVHHVFDDPARYGVDPILQKVEGSTMTSWFVLEDA
jgi:hypothetical protein